MGAFTGKTQIISFSIKEIVSQKFVFQFGCLIKVGYILGRIYIMDPSHAARHWQK
jgi:hypothetical protein